MCAPGVPWHHPLSILSTFPEDSRGGPAGSLEISLGVSNMSLVFVCVRSVPRVSPGCAQGQVLHTVRNASLWQAAFRPVSFSAACIQDLMPWRETH